MEDDVGVDADWSPMKASFSEDLECCTAHEEIPISRAASVSIREDVDVYHELLVLLQNQAKDKFVSDEKFLEKNRYHQKKQHFELTLDRHYQELKQGRMD